jgi:cation transport ATPase
MVPSVRSWIDRYRIAMEDARTLDAIIFDKTGTLTEGEYGVVGMETIDGVDEDDALASQQPPKATRNT